MAVNRRKVEREVLVDEALTIIDHENDSLAFSIMYNSMEKPEGAALLSIIHEESGLDGTWVTSEDLKALASMLLSVAAAIDVAEKPKPKQGKVARKVFR